MFAAPRAARFQPSTGSRRLGRLARTLGLLLAAAGACTAQAQGQPPVLSSQPLRLVAPFAAGGGVDIIGRAIADALGKQFGMTVLVENRTGAGGNVGSAYVARAVPDGTTLLIASNSNSYNDFLYSKAGYDPARDLVRVAQIGKVPMVLLGSPTMPARNVQEVVALAKARPDALNFGSGGNGTLEHLAYELFKRRTNINATHVPYRGGAQVYPDLISGQVQLMFNNQLAGMPYVKSGQLRAVGLTGSERSKQLPDVPTLAEQGVSGLDSTVVWWGLMAPAGTPPAVVAELNRRVNAALASPEVAARMESLGAQTAAGSAEKFEAFFTAERASWQQVIKDANIKLE